MYSRLCGLRTALEAGTELRCGRRLEVIAVLTRAPLVESRHTRITTKSKLRYRMARSTFV
jgi:hypothetical protein